MNALDAIVYRALLDARTVATWMAPRTGMNRHVHVVDARDGGSFRISLAYDAPAVHTDTLPMGFVKLWRLGHFTIQYASYMGFRVTTIARGAEKRGLALKLGAHHYVDSGTWDPSTELQP